MKRVHVISVCLILSIIVFCACTNNVEKAKKQYKKGEKALQEGKKDEAKKHFKKAIKTDPKNPDALFKVGFMYFDEEDGADAALGYLRKANKIDPNNEMSHYKLAILYSEQEGMTEYEISELSKTIKLNNDNDGAHFNLGFIYSQKRLYDDAEKEFKEVLRIAPKDVDAALNLGVVYVRKGDKDKSLEMVEKLKGMDANMSKDLEKIIDEAAAKEAAAAAAEKSE